MTSTTPVAGETGEMLPAGLLAHWQAWLGAAPGEVARLGAPRPGERATPTVTVVGSDRRDRPGWDGEVHPVTGVVDPWGVAVVSVAPRHLDWARALVDDGAGLDDLRAALPDRLDAAAGYVYRAVYRWCADPVPAERLADAGVWLPVDDVRVPGWLRPFGGSALVALADAGDDGGRYLAGVGLKRHDEHVHEIAVGTDEEARGQGLARHLVAQAARELLGRGVVPTYMHDAANVASARVADAAGFPDRGWTALGFA